MRSPRAILAEVERQGAELMALDRYRLALKGGDTRLRFAVDRHLVELLAILRPASPTAGAAPSPPAGPPPAAPTAISRKRPSPKPSRSCLDCIHHRPPQCVALGVRITRNRAHRCGTFEFTIGFRSKI